MPGFAPGKLPIRQFEQLYYPGRYIGNRQAHQAPQAISPPAYPRSSGMNTEPIRLEQDWDFNAS